MKDISSSKQESNNILFPPVKGDYIVSQKDVGHWAYGNYSTAYCGCSWIAIYNALLVLGAPQSPRRIITWMEEQSWLRGLVLHGLLGAYPWSVGNYFKQQGYQVTYGIRRKTIAQRAKSAEVSILFYLRPNLQGHYVTFYPVPYAGNYHFLNEIPREKEDIRNLEQFYSEARAFWRMGVFIQKPKEEEL